MSSSPVEQSSSMTVDDESLDVREMNQQLVDSQNCYKRLMEDYNILKNQYDEAMKLAQQVEQKHQENGKLQKLISSLKAEKDELSHRLEIALQMNEELRDKSVRDPVIPTGINKAEIMHMREEMERQKQKDVEQIHLLNEQIEDVKRDSIAAKTRTIELESQVMSLLEAAQSKYGQIFTNTDQLKEFLLLPEEIPEESDDNELDKVKSEADAVISKLGKKLSEEKKKRKAAVAKAKDSEARLLKQKQETESAIADLENEIEEMRKSVTENDMERRRMDEANEIKVQQLKDTIEKMKERAEGYKQENQRLDQLQKKPNPLAGDVAQLREKVKLQDQQLKESAYSVATLKKQVGSLISELKSSEQARERLEGKLKESESRRVQMNDEMIKLRSDKDTLELTNEEMSESLSTAVAQLKAGKTSFEQSQVAFSDLELEAAKVKQVNAMLQQNLDRQKQELEGLYAERERLMAVTQRACGIVKIAEMKMESASIEKQQLKAEVKELKHKLETETKPVLQPVVEEVPYTSWFSTEFSGELRSLISEIAQNEVLPLSAKLRHVLTVIGKYYNGMVKNREQIISEKSDNCASICDKVDSFMISLGTVINKDNLNLEQLLTVSGTANDVINSVTRVKEQLQQTNIEKAKAEELLEQLFAKLSAKSFEECINEIEQRAEENFNLIDALKKEKQENRQQKKYQKQLSSEIQEYQESLESNLQARNDKLAELEREKKIHISEIKSLREQIEELHTQVQRNAADHDDQLHAIEEEHNAFLGHVKERHDAEVQDLMSDIEEKQAKLEEYSDRVKHLDRELAQWKKTAQMMKKSKKEKEEELKDLASQLEEMGTVYNDRINEEKEKVKAQYEQLVDQLKQKNGELRRLSSNASESVATCEYRNRELLKRIGILERDNEGLKQQAEAQEDEMRRERQLLETKCKASTLQTEVKCQASLEDLKLRYEEEKTKLCGFVIRHFKEFFDGCQKLDSTVMKVVVERASAEYHKLRDVDCSIRRLLGISSVESTEDAVAKLLLSLYRSE